MPKQEPLSDVRRARGERGIWQRRVWEHLIRDETDYARHVEYCYINPVKHGLVSRVRDWPHSSFHRDVRTGIFRRTGRARSSRAESLGRVPDVLQGGLADVGNPPSKESKMAEYATLFRPTDWLLAMTVKL